MLDVMKAYAGQSLEVQEAIRRSLTLILQLLGQGKPTLTSAAHAELISVDKYAIANFRNDRRSMLHRFKPRILQLLA